ncbi:39S ribosomal protein L52, mitochondrial [Zerene cesonia]|uniref:39S ribosomal protein L52, mitochondrial n=1 Tax=Zerene cesonia TaxID=33412 RepID=UPI0018E55879|nr:39S ribosomal protein L52, mitochondrial [Zerene cesonia]
MALLQMFRTAQTNGATRSLCCTAALQSKEWRLSKGFSANRTAEGILTDGPDYTFLDGRPTPLLKKQQLRMIKQQDYATKIVELTSELEFAKNRYQDKIRMEQEERDAVLRNRLKPKGKQLKK